MAKMSSFKDGILWFGWDGCRNVLISSSCWAIGTLPTLMVQRISFSTSTVTACKVMILHVLVFFARSFCDVSLVFLDVAYELISK